MRSRINMILITGVTLLSMNLASALNIALQMTPNTSQYANSAIFNANMEALLNYQLQPAPLPSLNTLYAHTITVSPVLNGDGTINSVASGTALVNALTPLGTTPYLVILEPGVYALSGELNVPASVTLQGAEVGSTNVLASSISFGNNVIIKNMTLSFTNPSIVNNNVTINNVDLSGTLTISSGALTLEDVQSSLQSLAFNLAGGTLNIAHSTITNTVNTPVLVSASSQALTVTESTIASQNTAGLDIEAIVNNVFIDSSEIDSVSDNAMVMNGNATTFRVNNSRLMVNTINNNTDAALLVNAWGTGIARIANSELINTYGNAVIVESAGNAQFINNAIAGSVQINGAGAVCFNNYVEGSLAPWGSNTSSACVGVALKKGGKN